MASSQQTESLKAVLSRLNATNASQLPRNLHTLTTVLLRCRAILSASYDDPKIKGSQAAQLAARLRKQVGTLLNGKDVESKVAGVVLAKTVIEAGGHEMLKTCSTWVQAILSMLARSDPPITKKLCIVTLTKIFREIQKYPTLVREIGTPALQTFVPSCLNLISPKTNAGKTTQYQESLVGVVLESFCRLIPQHPTIFRSHHEQILSVIRPSMVSESRVVSTEVTRTAQRAFALLHYTAAKQGQSAQWSSTFTQVINETHAVTTQAFRAVLEDWNSIAGFHPSNPTSISDNKQDPSGLKLPQIQGIDATCRRLRHLLDLIATFCSAETASAVSLPSGQLLDLLNRIFAVTVPKSKRSNGPRVNDEISQEERQHLYSELPSIHATALKTLRSYLAVLGPACFSTIQGSLDQLQWVFDHEEDDETLRVEVFATAETLVQIAGPSFRKLQMTALQKIARSACQTLLPDAGAAQDHQAKTNGAITLQTDTFFNSTKTGSPIKPTLQTPLQKQASSFLTVLLSRAPDAQISRPLRALIDRTAILTNDKNMMIASVLSCTPFGSGKPNSSILVFLARAYPQDPVVESILRPRMPVVATSSTIEEADVDDDDLEERPAAQMSNGDYWGNGESESDVQDDPVQINGALDPALMDESADVAQESLSSTPKEYSDLTSEGSRDELPSKGILANGAAESRASSRKRTISGSETSPKPKRVHFDLGDDNIEETISLSKGNEPDLVPVPMTELSPETGERSELVTIPQASIATATKSESAADSDSDDDSDFEIPPLVLKGEEGDADDSDDEESYQ